jgi:hypothetical protein
MWSTSNLIIQYITYILLVQGCTRSGGLYIYLGEVNIVPIKVVPISVNKVESDLIRIRGGGATLPRLQQKAQTFWEGLYQGGGTWMWDYVLDVTSEPSWLPLALERGTVVLATDGSYNRKRGPNVSGAGWVIACRRSGNILKGSFFEFSSNASSYRGELLGLVAIHTLVLHACQFYQPTTVTGKIICNNKLALYKSSKKGHRRICPGVAQADLFRALQSIHQEMLGANLHYELVKSHQDSKFHWHLLIFKEQLNTMCDTLANEEVGRALGEPTFPMGPSLLPFEHSSVLINNIKITSNVAPQIRFLLGRVDAKKFYTKAIN